MNPVKTLYYRYQRGLFRRKSWNSELKDFWKMSICFAMEWVTEFFPSLIFLCLFFPVFLLKVIKSGLCVFIERFLSSKRVRDSMFSGVAKSICSRQTTNFSNGKNILLIFLWNFVAVNAKMLETSPFSFKMRVFDVQRDI